MVDEVSGRKNVNTGDRLSFTQINEIDPASNEFKWLRRVLAFVSSEHFQELTRQSFTSTKPKIKELDLVDKDTEYPFEFPVGVKQYEIIPQSQSRITYSYNENGTGTEEAIECDRFVCFEDCFLNLDEPLNVYMKADSDNTQVKIKYWT